MQKIKAFFEKGSPSLFLGVICASIGSALFIPSTGLVTTLPFVLLFSVIPALISQKVYHIPPMFFAVTYLFCFAKDVPLKYTDVTGGYTLYVAAFAAIISCLGCAAACLVKSAIKNKDKAVFKILASVCLAVLGVLGTCYLNGTPWAMLDAKGKISAHAEANFTEGELDIGGVYFVRGRNYYVCDAKIKGTVDKGSFVCADKVTNTLDALAVKYAGEDKTKEIAALLRKAFPEDSFSVDPDLRSFDGVKVSFNNTEELEKLISYTVRINSEETAKSFVEKASAFASVIGKSDIECSVITLTGGAKQKLYYTISVDTTAPAGNMGRLLRIYSTCLLPQSSVINAHGSFSK